MSQIIKRGRAAASRIARLRGALAQAVGSTISTARDEAVKTMGLNALLFNRLLEGGAVPTLQSLAKLNTDISVELLATLRHRRPMESYLAGVGRRARSGLRYRRLIQTLGKQLFASARFAGAQVIAETDAFRLWYLPPPDGVDRQKAAWFHVGGFIPFGDRIFRFLPEANMFNAILARGVPVYQMEIKGDRRQLKQAGRLTLDGMIDAIDTLSDRAFEHAGGEKLMLEGYCGLGMPTVCYAAAKPAQADRKFAVLATMVAPIDGKRCQALNDVIATVPRPLNIANHYLAELYGGYLSGHAVRLGIDVPFNAYFHKTRWGLFIAGWTSGSYDKVETIDQLDPAQRRELAASYWISPENGERFTIPASLAEFSTRLWTEGITDHHAIPASYDGKPLSLRSIRDQTNLQLVGIYGAKDLVVPATTADPLKATLGDRYTHVVHRSAGHITYVMFPEWWMPGHRLSFKPNPLDVMLAAYDRATHT